MENGQGQDQIFQGKINTSQGKEPTIIRKKPITCMTGFYFYGGSDET